MKKQLFLFLVSLQIFFCILALSQSVAESSFPRIIFRSPYCANTNMPEDSISYYFNQVKSMGANSIIGVCDSLSTKYGKLYGMSIIPFNQYGGSAKKVKVTERDRQYIEELTTYGFYLDLEAEYDSTDLNEGYAFYQDTLVSIQYQQDDTVGRWCKVADHDSGLVIQGPIRGSVYPWSPMLAPTTQCSANYVMKIGDKEGDPNTEVARLIITDPDSCIEWEESICVAWLTWTRSIRVSDFDLSGVYDTLGISFTQRRWHGFYYELFWTDVKDLWVDKVIVSNSTGRVLFSLTEDSVETPLQNYYSSLDTQLHRWYLVDEPDGGSLPAVKRANELIGSVQPGTWDPSDTTSIFTTLTSSRAVGIAGDLYLSDIEAKEFNVDVYPYDTTINHLQTELSNFCAAMDTCSKKARNFGKPFYATIQVHAWDLARDTVGEERDILHLRNPTPEEIKAEAYLALAYGARGLAYFWYTTSYYSNDTADWRGLGLVVWSPDSGRWVPNEKWYAVQEIHQAIDKIGPTLTNPYVAWLGACRSDTVGEPSFSFINSLTSIEYDTPFVEVGFFKDTSDLVDTNYFMLVNRRCEDEEEQNVTCYIDKQDAFLIIDLYEDDTTVTGYLDTIDAVPFTTHLDPGEGKLFKMVPYSDSLHGSDVPMKWQGGLIVNGDVTVDSGETLTIYRPAEISFTSYSDFESSGVSTSKCEIIVNGSLRIDPGGGGKAKFIPTESGLSPWYGIRVGNDTYPDARIFLDNVEIKQAYCGLDYQSTSAPDTIRNSIFRECKIYGIRCKGDSLVIHDNEFNFRSATCYGIYCDSSSSAKIWGNEFKNLNYGIYINNASPNLNNCGLSHNQFSSLSYGICVESSGDLQKQIDIMCQDMWDGIPQPIGR